ncbi:proline--tRNA ligase [Balamuthia mandrillaris]
MADSIAKLEAELLALREEQENLTEQFLEARKNKSAEEEALRGKLQEVKTAALDKCKEILALNPDWKEKKIEKKKKPAQKKAPAAGAAAPQKKQKNAKAAGDKSSLGLQATKSGNFSKWYSDVIGRAELIEYYDISGCYILRPYSFEIWEGITRFFDAEIKKLGVKNASFPLLVTKSALEKEEDHIEGFAAEVAWVTQSGSSFLAEPVAIRPTSETIMYPAYAKWVRSHRDLPLKLNQWTNIVRWEFKHPVPFLRSREFLWQEGHSAFATKKEADEEVLTILNLYRRVYEELLAVPVVMGQKSEMEKFAGGLYTTTCEAFIAQNGRAIQGATSHCLGQNFAKMFNIQFENEEKEKCLAWQNSWGITTRTLGVMIMVHGDDKGLVLPPRVAPLQVVLITIPSKDIEDEALHAAARAIVEELTAAGIRAHYDDRNHKPGYKYNHWELRGVPLRIELGPKDIKTKQVTVARRDKDSKTTIPQEGLAQAVGTLLEDIQESLFQKAKKERDDHMKTATNWEEFMTALDGGNLVLVPWCDITECEEMIKLRSGGGQEKKELTKEEMEAKKKQEEEEAKQKAIKQLQDQIERYQKQLARMMGVATEEEKEKEKEKEQEKGQPCEGKCDSKGKGKAKAEGGAKENVEGEGEEEVKNFGLKASAKSLCKPFSHPALASDAVCFCCGQPAKAWTLFGRSY